MEAEAYRPVEEPGDVDFQDRAEGDDLLQGGRFLPASMRATVDVLVMMPSAVSASATITWDQPRSRRRAFIDEAILAARSGGCAALCVVMRRT